MKILATLLLLTTSLFAQTYTLGDSHAQACYLGTSLAVPGATYQDLSKGLLEGRGRFAPLLRHLQHPETIILAFGTNDAVGFDSGKFRVTLANVVDVLQINYPTAKIILWGPPETKVRRVYVGPVADCLHDLSEVTGLQFVDRRFLTPDMFQKDGIHLTALGYAELRRRVVYHMETYP